MQLDEAFHRTLAVAADKAHVWSIVNNVKAQMDRLRQLSFIMGSAAERAVDQHHAIVEAIAIGDAGAPMQRCARICARFYPICQRWLSSGRTTSKDLTSNSTKREL